MIITDTTPKSPAKDSAPLLGGASGSNAPPAYTPPQAGPTPIGNNQIPYAVYQPAYTQSQPQGQQRIGESAGRRFCKALLVAFGLWILLSALFGSFTSKSLNGFYDYPIPGGVEPDRCMTTWSEMRNSAFSPFPYSASTSFNFDLPSKTLLLLSKGGLSSGHLKITSSSKVTDVQVNVTVNYYKAAVRDVARVCFIERSEGENGVGIFTPQPWRARTQADRLSFDVELILPLTDSILQVNGLSTDVNNFSHDVGFLNAHFNDLSLKASNGRIQAQSLSAAQAELITSNAHVAVEALVAPRALVKSSNGRISGSYVVVDSLDLRTGNGAIDVAVTVAEGSSSKKTKVITMQTSNNAIDYTVNLGPTSGKADSFHVKATSSNGRLTGNIVSAPLDSVLAVDAKTSNNKASVTLPSTYEGRFSVSTSNAPSAVQRVDTHPQDPAGKGRTRTIQTEGNAKKGITGFVHWDKKNAGRGKATVVSSNGAATLFI
ncbi:hypothetical protein K438DRAFT_1942246 [Mycena galopus ATCC 62051]|nr:hypothetical protein K438DRAFT_1942246 [Mycena galopus ATCC 62051]